MMIEEKEGMRVMPSFSECPENRLFGNRFCGLTTGGADIYNDRTYSGQRAIRSEACLPLSADGTDRRYKTGEQCETALEG